MNFDAIFAGYPKLVGEERRRAMLIGATMSESDFRRAMRNVYGEPVSGADGGPIIGEVDPRPVRSKRFDIADDLGQFRAGSTGSREPTMPSNTDFARRFKLRAADAPEDDGLSWSGRPPLPGEAPEGGAVLIAASHVNAHAAVISRMKKRVNEQRAHAVRATGGVL